MKNVTFLFSLLALLTQPVLAQNEIEAHIRSQAKALTKAVKNNSPRFSLIGELKVGNKTPYSINGEDISIASDALKIGNIRIGATVKARGIIANGKKIAKKVMSGNIRANGSDAKEGEVEAND